MSEIICPSCKKSFDTSPILLTGVKIEDPFMQLARVDVDLRRNRFVSAILVNAGVQSYLTDLEYFGFMKDIRPKFRRDEDFCNVFQIPNLEDVGLTFKYLGRGEDKDPSFDKDEIALMAFELSLGYEDVPEMTDICTLARLTTLNPLPTHY